MNPDKLFDYLDGKLPDHERQALEERLMSDTTARREFDVARRIHASMRESQSDRPEILSEMSEETAARGRRMARQVGLAFIVLMAMNVLLGLVYIAHHESKNPNRQLLNEQAREHVRQSLEKMPASASPAPNLAMDQIAIPASKAQRDVIVNRIVASAAECGGSVVKDLNDENGLVLFAEIPQARAREFLQKLADLGAQPINPTTSPSSSAGSNRRIQIRLASSENP
jgi:hypothetical protein